MIFITGAAGAGKSSVVRALKARLPQNKFDIHDIDEADKWDDGYESWRDAKIEHWLKQSIDNRKHGITTILCGIIYPDHVEKAPSYASASPVSYVLLDIPASIVTERNLEKHTLGTAEEKRLGRFEPDSKWDRWAKRQMEITVELRRECGNLENTEVFDPATRTADEIAGEIAKRIA
jgi:adenylate kinase family enzyme